MLPKSWKKPFNNEITMPTKIRFCNDCSKEECRDMCNNQINENNEFEANLNLFKRQIPIKFGYMLPSYKKLDDFFVIVCVLWTLFCFFFFQICEPICLILWDYILQTFVYLTQNKTNILLYHHYPSGNGFESQNKV